MPHLRCAAPSNRILATSILPVGGRTNAQFFENNPSAAHTSPERPPRACSVSPQPTSSAGRDQFRKGPQQRLGFLRERIRLLAPEVHGGRFTGQNDRNVHTGS